jgi:hypothetical protein
VQLPPAPVEQRMAKAVLQLADLHRDGRLRQVQLFRRSGQVAVMRHGPEQMQVMVVEISHSFHLYERLWINNVFYTMLHRSYDRGISHL